MYEEIDRDTNLFFNIKRNIKYIIDVDSKKT